MLLTVIYGYLRLLTAIIRYYSLFADTNRYVIVRYLRLLTAINGYYYLQR